MEGKMNITEMQLDLDLMMNSLERGFYHEGREVTPASVYYSYGDVSQLVDPETRVITKGWLVDTFYDGQRVLSPQESQRLHPLEPSDSE
jgi:hypothetical protein